MKLRSRLVVVLVALLTSATVAYAVPPPKPKLPKHPPRGTKLTSPKPIKPLSAKQRKKFKKCKQFKAAQRKKTKNRGWICVTNRRLLKSSPTQWSSRQVVNYGIGNKQIGSVMRGVNINMSGQVAQHGLSFKVLSGPQIWPYWAAGCRRYNNPADRADCGDSSGNAIGFGPSYSHGWNFNPFRGNSQMRTIFSFAIYAKGYIDPHGQHGAFVLPSVTSALYQCPKVGTKYACKFVGP